MNFKETLQFCIKNIMQGWVNTIPNMTGTYLQLNPLTFTLFFLTNLIPNVISRALVDFPLRPEEGVDNSR